MHPILPHTSTLLISSCLLGLLGATSPTLPTRHDAPVEGYGGTVAVGGMTGLQEDVGHTVTVPVLAPAPVPATSPLEAGGVGDGAQEGRKDAAKAPLKEQGQARIKTPLPKKKTTKAPAKAAPRLTSQSVRACENLARRAAPAWARKAGWTMTCAARGTRFLMEHDVFARKVTIYPTATTLPLRSLIGNAYAKVPQEYRNDPQADCQRFLRQDAVKRERLATWSITCVPHKMTQRKAGLAANDEGIWGLTWTDEQRIEVYTPGQRTVDVAATYHHEVGHALSAVWGEEDVRAWESVARAPWWHDVWEKRGMEIWAESYAAYRVGNTSFGPMTRLVAPRDVARQLARTTPRP